MIKRSLGFKARKYTFKSIFFTFWFLKRIIVGIYYFINQIVKEAQSKEGICPYCDSMNIEYRDSYKRNENICRIFICKKCNKKGREVYKQQYLHTERIENAT